MEIISIIGSVQTLFYLLLFVTKTKRNTSDYIFMVFLFLMGAMLFDNYLRNTDFYESYPQYWGITYCFPMLSAPLMYFYVILITRPEQRLSLSFILYLIPFFVFLTYFLINYYFLPAEDKVSYFSRATDNPWFMIYAAELFIVFSGPFYAVLSLINLHQHQRKIGHAFSYIEGINLNWLKNIFVLIVIVNIIAILSNVLSDLFPFISYKTADNLIFTINVILIFFLGFKGFSQKLIYNPDHDVIVIQPKKVTKTVLLKEASTSNQKYSKSGLNDSDSATHYIRLTSLIENEELYLNERLSIKSIADRLDLNVNHLSQIINQQSGKNFFRFINEYRVEKAKSLLSDPSNKKFTILGIAFECGFNSKSSFNSIFKEYTGKTPSEFQ